MSYGINIPLNVEVLGEEKIANVDRLLDNVHQDLRDIGLESGKVRKGFNDLASGVEKADASAKRLKDNLKGQNKLGWMTKTEQEVLKLSRDLRYLSGQMVETLTVLRTNTAAVWADAKAIEAQKLALIKADAALRNFSATEYRATVQTQNKLALERYKVSAQEQLKLALDKSAVAQKNLDSAEAKSLAISREKEKLLRQRNQLLAQQSGELKGLRAQVAALQLQETAAAAATHKFNLRMHVANQVAASTRAAVYGLGTSFGIYTSSTIVAAGATFAFFAGLRNTLSTGMKFEEQLTRLGALISNNGVMTQAYADDLGALKDRALEIAGSTRFMATEVLEAMTQLGLAGLSVEETIVGVRDVLNLAAIGAMDFAQASDIATNVMMGFGLGVGDLERVVDVLAKAASESNANVEQLGHSLSYAAPVAKSFGVSLEFTVATMEALANAGIKGSRAGTGVRRMLISLFTPNERAQKIMEKYGISLADTAKEMEGLESLESPIKGVMKEGADGTQILINKLEEFYYATAGATRNLDLLRETVGVYALPAFTQLIASIDMGKKSLFSLAQGFDDVEGSAAAALAKMQDNLRTSVLLLKSAAEATAIKIYDSESSGLRDFVDDWANVISLISYSDETIEAFIDLIKQMALTIFEVIKAVVYFKAAMLAFGLFKIASNAVSVLASAFGSLLKSLKAVTAYTAAFGFFQTMGLGVAMLSAKVGGLAAALLRFGGAVGVVLGGLYFFFTEIVDLRTVFADLINLYKKWTGVQSEQKSALRAEVEALRKGGLVELLRQRDTLEEQLQIQKAQGEENKDTVEQLREINKQLNDAYLKMERNARVNMFEDIKDVSEKRRELEKELRGITAEIARQTGKTWSVSGFISDAFLMGSDSYKGVKELTERTKDLNKELEVLRSKEKVFRDLRKAILTSSKDERLSLLEGIPTDAEKAIETIQAKLNELYDQVDPFKAGFEAVSEEIDHWTELLDFFKNSLEETGSLAEASGIAFGATLEKIDKAYQDTLAIRAKTAESLNSTEEERAARTLADAEAAVKAAKAEADALHEKYTAAKQAADADKENLRLRTEARNIGAEARGAAVKERESVEALTEAQKNLNKGVKDTSNDYNKLYQEAMKLVEAERALQETQIEQLQTWLEVNDQLIRRTEIYDTLIAKAKAYEATYTPTRITAYEATGIPSPASGTERASVPGRAFGPYADPIEQAARKWGVPPDVLAGVLKQESGFDPRRIGDKNNSWGMGQFNRRGAAAHFGLSREQILSMAPEQQIDKTGEYLRWSINSQKGDLWGGVDAYNKGPGRIPGTGDPNYVKNVQKHIVAATGVTDSLKQQRLAYTEVNNEMVVYKSNLSDVEKQQIESIKVNQQATNWLEAEAVARQSSETALSMLPATLGKVFAAQKQVALTGGQDLAMNEALTQAYKEHQEAMGLYLDSKKTEIEYEERSIQVGQKARLTAERSAEEWDVMADSYGTAYAEAQNFRLGMAEINALLERNLMTVYEHNVAMGEFRQRLADAQGPIAGFYESLNYGAEDLQNVYVDAMASIRDSIVEAFETGAFSAKEALDLIKKFIYQFLADKVIQALMAPFMGMGAAVMTGAAQAQGGAAGGGATATGATGGGALSPNGFSFSNLFGYGVGESAGGAMSWLNSFVGGSESSFLGRAASGAGFVPNYAYLGGGLLGGFAGNALFGGKGYGGLGSAVGSGMGSMFLGAALTPFLGPFGPLVGGLIGGVGGGFLGSLFGGEEQKDPVAWIDLQKGRFKGTKSQGMSDEQVEEIVTLINEVNSALDAMGEALGPEAKAIRDAVSRKDGPQALSPDQISDWLMHEMERVIGYMTEGVPGIMGDLVKEAFDVAGGDVNALLEQIAAIKQLMEALPGLIDMFEEVGMSLGENAEEAAISLVKLAGGLDVLVAAQGNYIDKFWNEEEKYQLQLSSMEKAFEGLKITMPQTREEFKALVEGLDLGTEEGRKLYIELMKLVDGFAELADAAMRITYDKKGTASGPLVTNYQDKFWTDEERLAKQEADMKKEWDSLGTAMPATRESFRELVDSIDLTTEAGRKQFESIMRLVDGMDQLYASAEQAAESLKQIQESATNTLMQNFAPNKEYLAYEKERARQAYRDAVGDNPNAIGLGKNTRSSYYAKAKSYPGGPAAYVGALGPDADKAMEAADAYYKAVEAISEAMNGAADAAQAAADSTSNLNDQLLEWVRKTREQNEAVEQTLKLQDARIAYEKALRRREKDKITSLADQYLELIKEQSTSSKEYAYYVALTTAQVEGLARSSDRVSTGSTYGYTGNYAPPTTAISVGPMPATFAEGGIAVGPKSGYAATLHGEEAVIPLENGSVPVDVSYEDLIAEIKALRYEVNAVGVKQVTYNKITADIINKWDRTGQPEQRDPV